MSPEITFEREDGVPIARLGGDVDAANAESILKALLDHLDNRSPGVVMDLARARYFDSAGMNMLFELFDQLKARRQRLCLVIPEGARVGRVMEIGGVTATIPCHQDLRPAVELVSRG